jgi:glycosyltransferase involved in cell wall biosynthesis
MIRNSDVTSQAFRDFVANRHAPVILQVLPALNAGGVEQGVIDINAAIEKAGGHSVVVSNGGKRVHEITKAGGTHIELPVHSKNPFVIWSNARKLRRIIREMKVDIVHACSRAPAWSAVKAVEGTEARLITGCHSAHKVSGNWKRRYNSSITMGERIIAVSDFLSGYLRENYEVDPAKIRVVHRGVALEKFHPTSVTPERLVRVSNACRLPEGVSIVMLPARLTRIKGHMFLLDAMAKLGRRDLFCLFVGSDIGNENYRAELEAYIRHKGLEGQVRMVTNCDDMPAAYMISEVVVCPSMVPEGFGRIPIEAQAMGRPVIATDHGGTRETIVRNETGWLVRPGDVNALANALGEALTLDPRARALLATRAMAHVAEHFTNEKMCAGTLDVYAELLGIADVVALKPMATTR